MFRATSRTVDELAMFVTAAVAGDAASVAPKTADAAKAAKPRIADRLTFMTLPLEADQLVLSQRRAAAPDIIAAEIGHLNEASPLSPKERGGSAQTTVTEFREGRVDRPGTPRGFLSDPGAGLRQRAGYPHSSCTGRPQALGESSNFEQILLENRILWYMFGFRRSETAWALWAGGERDLSAQPMARAKTEAVFFIFLRVTH
jgi:hypothetical protein